MRRILLIVTWLVGLAAAARAAEQSPDQPNKPVEPPASGSSSSLSHSGGVISPPDNVDPQMKQTPPASGDRMPVIPPPGSPGGDQSVKPK